MFKIFDLNMNEIPFPDGFMPLEIFVGSVGKNRYTQDVEGRSGTVDYGFDYTSRSVELFIRLKAKDHIDYRLLRNEVYGLFDTGSMFYIAESHLPSRVLKVVVDDGYIPDRLTKEYADIDITCRTLDSVFWESTYTTLELHDTGYSATAEKYGLVDNIDVDKVKYRFESEWETVELTSDLFEQGSMFLSNGQNSEGNTTHARTTDMYAVNQNATYRLNLNETGGTINYIRVFHYDSDGNHLNNDDTTVNVNGNGNTTLDFTADGAYIRLLVYRTGSETVDISGIGTVTQISLSGYSTSSTFTVYNAGNVTIEPESMQLLIQVTGATTDDVFTIRNKTTGEVFEFRKAVTNRHLTIYGMEVREGTHNAFRDTNRRFISLSPGDNEFEVSGGTFNNISFNFKYLYK